MQNVAWNFKIPCDFSRFPRGNLKFRVTFCFFHAEFQISTQEMEKVTRNFKFLRSLSQMSRGNPKFRVEFHKRHAEFQNSAWNFAKVAWNFEIPRDVCEIPRWLSGERDKCLAMALDPGVLLGPYEIGWRRQNG
jgi:hypothetical protein